MKNNMRDVMTQDAPAISVLKEAFARGRLAHVAVDWQFRYRPKEHLLVPLTQECHRVRAAFDRAATFTKAIYPLISTISLGFKAQTANNLFLRDAGEYGSVFWKQSSSAFDAIGFNRYMEASSYDTLIISGLYARDCQGATVRDALERGYKVVVPTDMVVSELKIASRNLSLENEPAGEEVDEDVRRFYFHYDDEQDSSEEGNLHGAKSYEITRALGL